jgi:hypothetical protein
MIGLFVVAFACGYAASIFTWDRLRAFISGAETELRSLETKVKAMRDKIGSL